MSANILEVENTIAAYLRQSYADFTVNGVNLLRKACNNARKHAERMHDWEHTKSVVSHTTSATGEFTLDASIKQVENFYLSIDGVKVPMRYASKRTGAMWAQQRISKRTVDGSVRYLADNDPSWEINGYTSLGIYAPYEVFVHGRVCQLHPEPSSAQTVLVDAYEWMDDYDADNDTDFFVTHGSDYLLYGGIVEVNFFNKTFADNQEGNFAAPVRMRDDALASLVEHDNFQVDGYRIIRR